MIDDELFKLDLYLKLYLNIDKSEERTQGIIL